MSGWERAEELAAEKAPSPASGVYDSERGILTDRDPGDEHVPMSVVAELLLAHGFEEATDDELPF